MWWTYQLIDFLLELLEIFSMNLNLFLSKLNKIELFLMQLHRFNLGARLISNRSRWQHCCGWNVTKAHLSTTCVSFNQCCYFDEYVSEELLRLNQIIFREKIILCFDSTHKNRHTAQWAAQIVHASVRQRWIVLKRNEMGKKNFWG